MMHFDFQLRTSYFANFAERWNLTMAKLLISERSNLFCGSRLKSQELIPIALEDSYCKYYIIEMQIWLMYVVEVSLIPGEARPQPFAMWWYDVLPVPTFASLSPFQQDGWKETIYYWDGNDKYTITSMLC